MRLVRLAAVALALGLLAACGGGDGGDGEARERIDVFGPYLGSDADAFAAVLAGFEDGAGVDVRYTGSGDFIADLRRRVEGGVGRPDVALVPQRGLVDELRREGAIEPLGSAARRAVEAGFAPPDVAAWTGPAEGYAIPYRATLKSLVWYRPEVLAANGWEVPDTLADLASLTERIAAAGGPAPWCLGVASGGATGWPATDWVEDLLLRGAGATTYDAWVAGTTGVADPGVRAAFGAFDDLVMAGGHVAGGRPAVVETPVAETFEPFFADPPGCVLVKQASFATTWFPSGTSVGPDGDVDVFVLPGADAEPAPLVVGGDLAVAFDARPVVDRLMAYLAGPEGAAAWTARGGFVSARAAADTEHLSTGVDARIAALLREPRLKRYDASDAMAPARGDALLTQITAWLGGATPTSRLLQELAAAP